MLRKQPNPRHPSATRRNESSGLRCNSRSAWIYLFSADAPDPVALDIARDRRVAANLLGFSNDGSQLFLQVRTENATSEAVVWDVDQMRVARKFPTEHNYGWNFRQLVNGGKSIVLTSGGSTSLVDTRSMRRPSAQNEYRFLALL